MQTQDNAVTAAERFEIDPLLSMREVSKIVNLGPSALFDRMRRGAFPPGILLSRRCRRWRRSTVVNWLESL